MIKGILGYVYEFFCLMLFAMLFIYATSSETLTSFESVVIISLSVMFFLFAFNKFMSSSVYKDFKSTFKELYLNEIQASILSILPEIFLYIFTLILIITGNYYKWLLYISQLPILLIVILSTIKIAKIITKTENKK